MIAADSSSVRRYLDGLSGRDVDLLDRLRADLHLPPIVVTELLSEPTLDAATRQWILGAPLLPLHPAYWERAGTLRASLLRAGHKAKLADCLIAQSCIDSAAPLITYDRDFRHFAAAGLRLL